MNKQCNRLSFLNISNINIPAGVTRLPYKYCYKGEDPLALRHSFSTALLNILFANSFLSRSDLTDFSALTRLHLSGNNIPYSLSSVNGKF